jgi:hypothetical protein
VCRVRWYVIPSKLSRATRDVLHEADAPIFAELAAK